MTTIKISTIKYLNQRKELVSLITDVVLKNQFLLLILCGK
ncbi:glycerol-3-phosphate regulon repressor [Vibrio cholerae]|nr:glycerol-3-phosphate regulon repressor [Vibrio cholerae]EGQ8015153.1 glycerol-3-phosphate regulon repressor [Vibrio cholerae]EGR0443215.1 glycerol-3-phosphate regulon repressor [Vibrio cholerae]EGR0451820.1 glycerol-3-phosphate regulon repressor [Vibrio cholerae]EGR1022600.1 glycerol-3-phosphate regulon repressor [Vibrio cholerae]EGR1064338.1 glycerol-3-phosphate regulon repressor [Vibrio cholerae]